jgi:hypothetical protein
VIEDVRLLLDTYTKWLRDKSTIREVGGSYVEITTPYLDRNNDYMQIFARKDDGGLLLTDMGETIAELKLSGCELDSRKRRDLLHTTLNGFGVQLKEDKLLVRATAESFPMRKHNLVQAMLAVNDLFYLAAPTVANLFYEDVERWLSNAQVRFLPRVKFTGRTGYDQYFDFAIPKSATKPERLVNAIANPNKNAAQHLILSWIDTKEVRSPGSRCLAILNNVEREIPPPVEDALASYDIVPVRWTERDVALPELAA